MAFTLPLTPLDEAFLDLSDQALLSVQFEVRVGGRLDPERLLDAMRHAASRHPLARARLAAEQLGTTRRHWEVADVPDHLALEVTSDPAPEVRARLQSLLPDLAHSPGYAAAVVRDDGGDYLMLNLHHAAFDGMSAVRLVTSIARAYASEADDLGGPAKIEEARDLREIAGSRNLADLIPRVRKIAEAALQRRDPLVRVASDDAGQGGDRRYGFATTRLDPDAAARVVALKPKGATVNDLVLAAHVRTIRRWNVEHGHSAQGRISIMMPVNLRPAEWSSEVLSNYASYLAIIVPDSAPNDLSSLTRHVSGITQPIKQNGAAGWVVDLLDRGPALPVFVKRNLQSLLPLVQSRFVESTVVSNIGRVAVPAFDDAGPVREVWFSPPCMGGEVMPLAVGVAGVGRELQLVVRTESRVISPGGAKRYASMLHDTLTGRS